MGLVCTAVARLGRALSQHFGPDDVLLTMEIQFQSDLSAAAVASAIDRLDRRIRSLHPEVRYIFLEAQSLAAPARIQGLEATARLEPPSFSMARRAIRHDIFQHPL